MDSKQMNAIFLMIKKPEAAIALGGFLLFVIAKIYKKPTETIYAPSKDSEEESDEDSEEESDEESDSGEESECNSEEERECIRYMTKRNDWGSYRKQGVIKK